MALASALQPACLPLCRAQFAAAFVLQPLQVKHEGTTSNGTALWAIGYLADGQSEVLGVWCGAEPAYSLSEEALIDLRRRGLERVHVVLSQDEGMSVSTQLGAHSLPSPGALLEKTLAHVGPRVRRAVSDAVLPVAVAESIQAAEAALSNILAGRLGASYPDLWSLWSDALPRLEPLFELPAHLRRLLLLGDSETQRLRRSLSRSIRRHGSFPSRQAAVSFLTRALDRAELAFDISRAPAVGAGRRVLPRGLGRPVVSAVHA